MFNIKSEKKSWKMSFKALPVKTQRLKNPQPRGGQLKLKQSEMYVYIYIYIYIYIKFGCSNIAYYNCTWSWYLSHSKSTIFYCVILRKNSGWQNTRLNRVVLVNIQLQLKDAALQTVKQGDKRLCDTHSIVFQEIKIEKDVV